jgi:hypothetical protein
MRWAEIINPSKAEPPTRGEDMRVDCEICHDCDRCVGPVIEPHEDRWGTETERLCWEVVYGNDTNDDLLCEDCYSMTLAGGASPSVVIDGRWG